MMEDKVVGWHQHDGHEFLSKLQEMMKEREAWYVAAHGVIESDMTE